MLSVMIFWRRLIAVTVLRSLSLASAASRRRLLGRRGGMSWVGAKRAGSYLVAGGSRAGRAVMSKVREKHPKHLVGPSRDLRGGPRHLSAQSVSHRIPSSPPRRSLQSRPVCRGTGSKALRGRTRDCSDADAGGYGPRMASGAP